MQSRVAQRSEATVAIFVDDAGVRRRWLALLGRGALVTTFLALAGLGATLVGGARSALPDWSDLDLGWPPARTV
ncbi:MAG TPA: hypothetical protein VF755_21750, partial [Catenuloplanes sp.]